MFSDSAEAGKHIITLLCVYSIAFLPTEYSFASDSSSTEIASETSMETDHGQNTETSEDISLEAVADSEEADSMDILSYADVITEEYFYSELPIVFTATRLEQSVAETPVSMTIIDEEMIRASGALEIAELMRLVPGMQVANYGGDEYFVTYHGRADLYSRSLQVLVDGRSIYNPVIGGVAWSDLPLAMEDIERIEVIRGSNAAAFGSNSFSGVINIITKKPSELQGTLFKTTIGNKNTRQVLARNAGSLGNLDYRLTINYDEKDGIQTRHDDASNKWLNFRGDYQYDISNHFTLQAGYSKGTQQTGYEDSDWNIPRDTDSTSSFQQIKWTHTEDKDSEYSLHFFHNHKKLDDSYTFQYGPFNLETGLSYESDRYELEFQHSLKPESNLRLVWGLGLRHDNTESYETLNQDSSATRNQVHTFINAEWKPKDDLTVNLGAMLEKYEGFSSLFSPRVALNYSLKDNHIFRISHSTAYRMPNVWEEQIDMAFRHTLGDLPFYQLHKTVGVPEPEEINSIEFGYMAALTDIPLTLDAKLFKERISPVINYAWDNSIQCVTCTPLIPGLNDSGAGNFNNDGKIDISGFELQLDYQPTANTNIHAVYSRLHASGWQVDNYDSSGNPSSYIDVSEIVPSETIGILVSHRFDNGVHVSSGFYHTDRVTWLDPGDETDSYNKWDFRIGKTFPLPDASIDVSAIIHNVSNESYQEYYDLNEAQREIYLQIGVKF